MAVPITNERYGLCLVFTLILFSNNRGFKYKALLAFAMAKALNGSVAGTPGEGP